MAYIMYEKTIKTMGRKGVRRRDTHKQTLFRTKKGKGEKITKKELVKEREKKSKLVEKGISVGSAFA